ncbi:Rieske 2Fe-2S domain-containing protein [Bradyrhizobium sp. USDA 4486]
MIWNDGDVVACDRACPHDQADLGLGQLTAGRLRCPHQRRHSTCATAPSLRAARPHAAALSG